MEALGIILIILRLLLQMLMTYKFIKAYYYNDLKGLIFYGVLVIVLLN